MHNNRPQEPPSKRPRSLYENGTLIGDNGRRDSMSYGTGHSTSINSSAARFPVATTQNETPVPSAIQDESNTSPQAEKELKGTEFKVKSSIPSGLSPSMYGRQCVAAAYSSRLNPYALHWKEQKALQDKLCHGLVTVYLNIRNGILRMWLRNPMASVTKQEALGCVRDSRAFDLAYFAYRFLVRNGYINFGCVEVPLPPGGRKCSRNEVPVIVVVGAGMSGLGCARQLEGLFRQHRERCRVILLEGKGRIGGRIYSRPLKSMVSKTLPEGLNSRAEMGAQIIVGFDKGNPLDQIVRGQLALHCHMMRDIMTVYDVNGLPVNTSQDTVDEFLHDDILERAGLYRQQPAITPTTEGDKEMIYTGRESWVEDGITIRQYEEARVAERLRGQSAGHEKASETKSAGISAPNIQEEHPAIVACRTMGWKVKRNVSLDDALNLDSIAKASETQTLGAVMDEGIKRYQSILPLTCKDLRLMNWHLANLEYANATNVGNLSLSRWDQDMGNMFEGAHSQIIGGYEQVPYGLYSYPEKLEVKTKKAVSKISYDPTGKHRRKALVQCEGGEALMADEVVFTGSLGVLKQQSIEFDPPLPDWKTGAIERLGFGLINKVVLVFGEPFWDTERDMFGLLREPKNKTSLRQEDYSENRGKCYLFWNCLKTSGLPILVGMMVGDAAIQTEQMTDHEIVSDTVSQLRSMFRNVAVPDPMEYIITRWSTEKFTKGTYSYVAAESRPGDYDLMAQPVGTLHFAGEATCGDYPATVHGAYLSGLRAASDVYDSLMGPLNAREPLVPSKNDNMANANPRYMPRKKTEEERREAAAARKRVSRRIQREQREQKKQEERQELKEQKNGQQSQQLTGVASAAAARAPTAAPVAPAPAPTAPTAAPAAPAPAPTAAPTATPASTPSSAPSSAPAPAALTPTQEYQTEMLAAVEAVLGEREPQSNSASFGAYILYRDEFWEECRAQCDEAIRYSTNNPKANADIELVREHLGIMWRQAREEVKSQYFQQAEHIRRSNVEVRRSHGFDETETEWKNRKKVLKEVWCEMNPYEEWRGKKYAHFYYDSRRVYTGFS